MQRRLLKALRNIAPESTVSVRALKVLGTSFSGLLHQPGTSHQRTCPRRRVSPEATMISIGVVGAML